MFTAMAGKTSRTEATLVTNKRVKTYIMSSAGRNGRKTKFTESVMYFTAKVAS